jgi:ABC-type Fe3+/spermidine/putrescine transport system ATPase subunit
VVIEPNVLLLDEPLSNLDPTLRHSTRDELRAMLRRVGAPALFVTHDQEDAFAVADRIVLLSHGRVLQIGTPRELYTRPSSRDVASFIGRATLVAGRDAGDVAVVTIAGVTREVSIAKPAGTDGLLGDGWVALRPELLVITAADDPRAWPGTITGRRFAGASTVYSVTLSPEVTVEVSSLRDWGDDAAVGISVDGTIPFVTQ